MSLCGFALSGCAPHCLLPAQRPVTQLELFFGLGIPGGGQVGTADWAAFAGQVLTPAFPDGFTVYEAYGQRRETASAPVSREPSRVVQVLGPVTAAQVRRVTEAYRARFRQVSVGVVTTHACAAF